MESLKEFIKNKGINLHEVRTISVNGKSIKMTVEDLIMGVARRMSPTRFIEVVEKNEKSFPNYLQSMSTTPKDVLLRNELFFFLEDMGVNFHFEGKMESTWKEFEEQFEYDSGFLKWWAKENNVSDQQMFCDHDSSDQFSEDGHWYNSVGTCRKCLLDEELMVDYNENLDLVYSAWNRVK